MPPKPQRTKCTARVKKTGKPCQAWAVVGYKVCNMHGANPQNHGGAPKGNKNAMTQGIFSNDLQDEEEKRLYQEYYQALRKDFKLNNSSDRMTCQMACIFFIRLRRAVLNGENSNIALMESLVRNQLKDLKATRDKREADPVGLRTSPAEWVANLIKEVEETRAVRAEKKRKQKKKAAPVTDGDKTA